MNHRLIVIDTNILKRKFNKYISDAERQEFLNIVSNYSQFIEIKSQINTCRDPDDNKFLELAKDANAEFLITGDQDLLLLKNLPEYKNQIITRREFITLD